MTYTKRRGVVNAAIVQHGPVFMDLDATMAKLEAVIAEVASRPTDLVVFGETWLPGYPVWVDTAPGWAVWDDARTKAMYARLRANSVTVPGPGTDAIGALARRHGVTVVIGVNERVDRGPGSRTLYNSLLTFGPDGRLLNHHRKLVPTYTERVVWGPGDAGGLGAVDTPAGRVGGLICWEHWMPLPRAALHDDAEDIHVAVWPTAHEKHQIASRHYALEGRCYVLAAGQVMRASELTDELEVTPGLDPDTFLLGGGSSIIGPDGAYVVEPVLEPDPDDPDQMIVRAELDLSAIDREAMTLDVTGHYARRELMGYHIDRFREDPTDAG